MTALSAFELLRKCERARGGWSEKGDKLKDEALDAVIAELSRCLVEILTPGKEPGKEPGEVTPVRLAEIEGHLRYATGVDADFARELLDEVEQAEKARGERDEARQLAEAEKQLSGAREAFFEAARVRDKLRAEAASVAERQRRDCFETAAKALKLHVGDIESRRDVLEAILKTPLVTEPAAQQNSIPRMPAHYVGEPDDDPQRQAPRLSSPARLQGPPALKRQGRLRNEPTP